MHLNLISDAPRRDIFLVIPNTRMCESRDRIPSIRKRAAPGGGGGGEGEGTRSSRYAPVRHARAPPLPLVARPRSTPRHSNEKGLRVTRSTRASDAPFSRGGGGRGEGTRGEFLRTGTVRRVLIPLGPRFRDGCRLLSVHGNGADHCT